MSIRDAGRQAADVAWSALDVIRREPGPIMVAGAAWTLLNAVTWWILVGPALYALFRMALRVHRRQPVGYADMFAGLREEPLACLVAGILFIVPFRLWTALDDLWRALQGSVYARADVHLPGVPLALSLALLVHFALHVHVFAVLAEKRCSLFEAVRGAYALADRNERPGHRSALAMHLAFNTAVLAAYLLVGALWHGLPAGPAITAEGHDTVKWTLSASEVVTALMGAMIFPVGTCFLAAWYADRTGPARAAPSREDVLDDDERADDVLAGESD